MNLNYLHLPSNILNSDLLINNIFYKTKFRNNKLKKI